jgi:hypothetical protein
MIRLHICGLLAVCSVVGCENSDRLPNGKSVDSAIHKVALTIDFGGRRRNKELAVEFEAPVTVLTILEIASQSGHLTLEATGRGERAFVTAIDGLKNQPQDDSNWIYFVNNELADRGCGSYLVRPDDAITWKFGSYRDAQQSAAEAARQ